MTMPSLLKGIVFIAWASSVHSECSERRIRSYNFPSFNFGLNADGLVSITTKEESFRIVSPGLMGTPSTVSFESIRFPGRYLRHRSYILHLDAFTEGNYLLFKKDATFYRRDGIFFEGYTAYESYNLPNYFIRHQNYGLRISLASNPPTDLFKKDASFVEFEDQSSVTKTYPAEFVSSNSPQRSIGFTNENLPAIVEIDTERFRLVSPGLNGQCGTISFESERYPGYYLRHKNFLIHLNPFEERSVFFHDATFWLRNGILQQGYVSFESYNFPNRYIRHQGFRLKLHTYDGTSLFKKDASFSRHRGSKVYRREGPYRFASKNIAGFTIGLTTSGIVNIIDSASDEFYVVYPGLTGEEGTVSLESVAFPGYYLRHKNFLIHLDPFEESAVYKPDATYYLSKDKFYSGYFTLESRNLKDYFVRHQNYRLKISKYDQSELFRLDSSFMMKSC